MRIHETDVLVVGGGLAGMRAALAAAEAVDVTVAVKGKLGRSGSSAITAGGYAVAGPAFGGGWEAHLHDTLVGGAGLNDRRLAELMCQEAYERLLERCP